jgi:hypothetical protein
MSATAPTFSAAALGQTEKALNAILERHLAGTGLTEPQWVTLVLTVTGDPTADRDELAGRVAGALKVTDAEAQARVGELAAAGLVHSPDAGSPLTVTDTGRRLFGDIRAAIGPITERMWGDLPPEDLAAAGRVLATVLERADAELAA